MNCCCLSDRIRSLRGTSFGQEGEDRVLALTIEDFSPKLAQHGFYIDVGVTIHIVFQTLVFYKRWRGSISMPRQVRWRFRRALDLETYLEVVIGGGTGSRRCMSLMTVSIN